MNECKLEEFTGAQSSMMFCPFASSLSNVSNLFRCVSQYVTSVLEPRLRFRLRKKFCVDGYILTSTYSILFRLSRALVPPVYLLRSVDSTVLGRSYILLQNNC